MGYPEEEACNSAYLRTKRVTGEGARLDLSQGSRGLRRECKILEFYMNPIEKEPYWEGVMEIQTFNGIARVVVSDLRKLSEHLRARDIKDVGTLDDRAGDLHYSDIGSIDGIKIL